MICTSEVIDMDQNNSGEKEDSYVVFKLASTDGSDETQKT